MLYGVRNPKSGMQRPSTSANHQCSRPLRQWSKKMLHTTRASHSKWYSGKEALKQSDLIRMFLPNAHSTGWSPLVDKCRAEQYTEQVTIVGCWHVWLCKYANVPVNTRKSQSALHSIITSYFMKCKKWKLNREGTLQHKAASNYVK